MVKCEVRYEGGLHCRLQHGPSGAAVATDAPVDNRGKGESFSPTDLMCAAMAACMETIMGIYAEDNGLDLSGTCITVGKVMSANPRRIARIETEISVPLPAGNPHQAALEDCVLGSPAMRSLHPDIEVPITWNWVG
ncbi:MAG: OsmC family protein [Akkermansia sp.]|nr:OsmC family protein [Akkermansia sp.]MBR2314754.1 OsmC family protein [Akkermansia sp.]